MMKYDPKNGFGLWFTKSEPQYEDCIIYRETQEDIIRLADTIIFSLTGGLKNLLSELNDMQTEVVDSKLFENKFTIPVYFVNLILKQYNMKILYDNASAKGV